MKKKIPLIAIIFISFFFNPAAPHAVMPEIVVESIDALDGNYSQGDTVIVNNSVKNMGEEAVSEYRVDFYASTDIQITPDDYYLGYVERDGIDAGAIRRYRTKAILPDDIPEGEYYIGIIISVQDDTGLNNNTGYDNDPIRVTSSLKAVEAKGHGAGMSPAVKICENLYYLDADKDGYGDPRNTIQACEQPSGYVTNGQDCDDRDVDVYPGAPELCDGRDSDCDGLIDELDPDCYLSDYYCDDDGDGFIDILADGSCIGIGCEPVGCQTTAGNDCDDNDESIYMGAEEICDGQDNDCDGEIDESCMPDMVVSKVILKEDFSDGIPEGWRSIGAWNAENVCEEEIDYPFEPPWLMVDSLCTVTRGDEIITEPFDAQSCTKLTLAFSNQYYWQDGYAEILVSNDSGETWRSLITMSENDGYPVPNWKLIDMSTVAGSRDLMIKFKYLNKSPDGFWVIDNVWVMCQSAHLEFITYTQIPSSPQTILIGNKGRADLFIERIEIKGDNLSEFYIERDNCSGQTLAFLESCSIDIVFLPSFEGIKNAELYILSNDSEKSTLIVNLTGNGVLNVPLILDLKANGSDTAVNIKTTERLIITVELSPGSLAGVNADWWILAETPGGWVYYDIVEGWQSGSSVTYQGPLTTLPAIEVLNISGLSPGSYIFYFAVDTNMNGKIDYDQLYYDGVIVKIIE
jgi:hypothetical protein